MKTTVTFVLAAMMASYVYRNNHSLEISYYEIENQLVKQPFRVVHLSDAHIPYSGFRLIRLINEIKKIQPDLILMTGDMLDRKLEDKDIKRANDFFNACEDLAPIFMVNGNHDPYLKTKWTLNNEKKEISVKDNVIDIIGLNPLNPKRPEIDENKLTLILDHYPREKFEGKNAYRFSGHIHGGQFRVKNQGILSPTPSFFPKLSKGYYSEYQQFVSAGLGASQIPIRINNPNHVIVVDFK